MLIKFQEYELLRNVNLSTTGNSYEFSVICFGNFMKISLLYFKYSNLKCPLLKLESYLQRCPRHSTRVAQ